MVDEARLKQQIQELLSKHSSLGLESSESEKRAEEFIRDLFECLGWDWLSSEIIPQKKVKTHSHTRKVDYCFQRTGELRPTFYLEAKAFSDPLDNPAHIEQALWYGKNGRIRWVVLTNFSRWRVFNSDFFDEQKHAELFEFNLEDCLSSREAMDWLLLFSREQGGQVIDHYAHSHKKWKESADIEELLSERLNDARRKLSNAIYDQNKMKFDTGQDEEKEVDECVQLILDRIIFCRMLEDNGGDPERKLENVKERWASGDRRVQFYREHLCPFFIEMEKKYDSTIFDQHRIDRLTIKNEDFVPVLDSFYKDPKTGLPYKFDVISVDVLGHAYENYLSTKFSFKRRRGSEDAKKFARKQAGIYYTPEFMVDFLVRSTLGEKLSKCKTPDDALKLRVLDPACGSGTFLVRAFEEFRHWFRECARANPKADGLQQMRLDSESDNGMSGFLDSVLEHCLYGIDIDPRAVRLTRLNLFIRAVTTPKQLPKLNIIERNSLVWDTELNGMAKLGWPFIFERDFPNVSEAGGFDVVLGNPPWEKWKPDSQEFFELIEPGFKSLPNQEARKHMEEILGRSKLVRLAWEQKQKEYATFSEIFRDTYKFQSMDADGKRASGDLDLYKLFTERFHQLLKPSGSAGMVVPSGIYTDLGAKGLRSMLFDKSKLRALYSFENRGHALFPAVPASYKPIVLVFEKGGKTKEFPCAFFLHSQGDLDLAVQHPTVLGVEFVKKSAPTSWGVLEIKSQQDFEIVNKLLKHPLLGDNVEGAWNIELSRGFDMTQDSNLFREGRLGGVPMLEGKNIEQFTHQWKEAPTARYTIAPVNLKDSEKVPSYDKYWLGFRRIASSTNYRTLIAAIVPPGYCCAESITFVKDNVNSDVLCYLCGVLNSFVLDYFIRQKVSANINMFHFKELPVPRLSSGSEFEAIARKTAQLVSTTGEFAELKKYLGIEHGLPGENERALARAQLDAMVAKLYGLTKEELAVILEKFPTVDDKTKQLVLGQY